MQAVSSKAEMILSQMYSFTLAANLSAHRAERITLSANENSYREQKGTE
jgi:hypothetical protein